MRLQRRPYVRPESGLVDYGNGLACAGENWPGASGLRNICQTGFRRSVIAVLGKTGAGLRRAASAVSTRP